MPKLDVVKAAFAGFGVIGRNPVAVLVWGLVLLVLGVLPILGLVGGFISAIVQLAAVENAGAEPTPEQVMPLIGSIFAMMPILMITGLVLRTVLTGAVYRAVLFPQDRSWFYLRISARELWLALVLVVFGVLFFVVYVVLSMVSFPLMLLAGLGGAGMNPDDPAAAMAFSLALIPIYLLMMGVFAFLFVRFGLAFPMTFAESKFRLFESWTLTKGNGWRLFLVILLLVAMAIGLEIVAWIVIMIIAAGVAGAGAASGWSEESFEAFFAQDPGVILASMGPWIALGVVVACVLGAVVTTLFTAPWADAYRQLRADPAPPEPAPAV